jgi:hypothetical protein
MKPPSGPKKQTQFKPNFTYPQRGKTEVRCRFSEVRYLSSAFCFLSMAMSEKSIFAIIIGHLFHIRPLRTNTSISEMTKSLSARTFPLKNKYRCLKLDDKKILQHIGNLIYIIRNLGPVAQRLEQWTHNPLVVGSNPTGPSSQHSESKTVTENGKAGTKTENKILFMACFLQSKMPL